MADKALDNFKKGKKEEKGFQRFMISYITDEFNQLPDRIKKSKQKKHINCEKKIPNIRASNIKK